MMARKSISVPSNFIKKSINFGMQLIGKTPQLRYEYLKSDNEFQKTIRNYAELLNRGTVHLKQLEEDWFALEDLREEIRQIISIIGGYQKYEWAHDEFEMYQAGIKYKDSNHDTKQEKVDYIVVNRNAYGKKISLGKFRVANLTNPDKKDDADFQLYKKTAVKGASPSKDVYARMVPLKIKEFGLDVHIPIPLEANSPIVDSKKEHTISVYGAVKQDQAWKEIYEKLVDHIESELFKKASSEEEKNYINAQLGAFKTILLTENDSIMNEIISFETDVEKYLHKKEKLLAEINVVKVNMRDITPDSKGRVIKYKHSYKIINPMKLKKYIEGRAKDKDGNAYVNKGNKNKLELDINIDGEEYYYRPYNGKELKEWYDKYLGKKPNVRTKNQGKTVEEEGEYSYLGLNNARVHAGFEKKHVLPGLDEFGWPLEVADDKYLFGEAQKKIDEGSVLLDVWMKRDKYAGRKRRIPPDCIEEMDISQQVPYMCNEFDMIRDSIRDGRYNRHGTLGAYEYAMVNSLPQELIQTEWAMNIDGKHRTEAAIEDNPEKWMAYEMQLKRNDKYIGVRKAERRVVHHLAPGFDKRILPSKLDPKDSGRKHMKNYEIDIGGKEGGKKVRFEYFGGRKYYHRTPGSANAESKDEWNSENPKLAKWYGPKITTRGLSNYLLDVMFMRFRTIDGLNKFMESIEFSKTGGFDWGPRVFDMDFLKNPYQDIKAREKEVDDSLMERAKKIEAGDKIPQAVKDRLENL